MLVDVVVLIYLSEELQSQFFWVSLHLFAHRLVSHSRVIPLLEPGAVLAPEHQVLARRGVLILDRELLGKIVNDVQNVGFEFFQSVEGHSFGVFEKLQGVLVLKVVRVFYLHFEVAAARGMAAREGFAWF